MNKRNYSKELEALIAKISDGSKERPSLLLHACCAPCSSYCLEYLAEYFNITVLYYNPNIFPEEEYNKRVEELIRFVSSYPFKNQVEVRSLPFDPKPFYEAVKGLEALGECSERCFACYRLRMEVTARMAAEEGFDYFTTTLSISPHKNAGKINEIGEELAVIYPVKHLPSDFKKKNGFLRSTELSNEYGMYRQDYCGCIYSKNEKNTFSSITNNQQ